MFRVGLVFVVGYGVVIRWGSTGGATEKSYCTGFSIVGRGLAPAMGNDSRPGKGGGSKAKESKLSPPYVMDCNSARNVR